jgi:hypothetical protein
MGLSFNPVDVWKLFSDGKRKEKEQIAAWLEQTAAEARQIADVWLETAHSLPRRERGFQEDIFGGVAEPISITGSSNSNSASYSRLEESYDAMSSVLGARVERDWQDAATDSTAQVLMRRNQVKTLYERLYGPGKQVFYVDQDSRADQLDELQSAIAFLNREAAALEILARRFRALA